jgi:hypothetical protein
MSTIPEIKISAFDHLITDILKSKTCIHLQISKWNILNMYVICTSSSIRT